MNPIGSPLARRHVLAIGLRGGGVLGHLKRRSVDTIKDKESRTRETGKKRPAMGPEALYSSQDAELLKAEESAG